MTNLSELAARIEAADADELFDFTGNPSWTKEGGEHFDGNWTPDCGGKLDYDPTFLRFSCRVWRDGDYSCSLYLGSDFQIEQTGILSAGSVDDARAAVELWCQAIARKYASLCASALRAKEVSDHG